jgi:tripartite-type tricarboxylate transporter receptor subunit TctC
MLKARTHADLTHIPYKGAAPALNDLIGGHVDLYFPGMPAVIPHLKSGLLKVLAVSSAKRSAIAPDVPTVAEASPLKDFDFTLWVGFFAPARTPSDVVARLNSTINAILADPDIKAKLVEAGAEVTPMSVDQFTAFVRSESSKYLRIIKETGATGE